MAALPYMQLYVADYLADTAYLDVVESGAYLHLLMNYWQTGKPLPNDDKRLARIAKCSDEQWLNVRSTVLEYFVEQENVLIHNRVENDLALVMDKQSKASIAGKASGEARRRAKLDKKGTDVQRPLNGKGTPVVDSLNHTDTDTDTDTDTIKEKPKELPPHIVSFSESFYQDLSKNGGKQKYTAKEVKTGADTVDKLVRIDGFNLDSEIGPALKWGLADEFWSGQIRSLGQLRKKSKSNGEMKFTNLFNQFSARSVKNNNTADGIKPRNMREADAIRKEEMCNKILNGGIFGDANLLEG